MRKQLSAKVLSGTLLDQLRKLGTVQLRDDFQFPHLHQIAIIDFPDASYAAIAATCQRFGNTLEELNV